MSVEYGAFAVLATLAVLQLHARRRLDVVEVHAPPEFLVACGLVPRLLGARLALDIRDLSPHLFSARFMGRRAGPIIERILWAMVRASCALADTVITVHEPYREELARNGVPHSKVTIVMNAPDERLLGRVRAAARPSGTDGHGFTVAYHGTITSWYGVEVLVLAIAALRSAGYDVRGRVLGEGDAFRDVRRLARDRNVAEFIEFTGRYVPISEALQRVQTATCGVITNTPSLLNDFILSNKLLEYVALGIPVVASDLRTSRAHFDDAEVTYFRSGDPDACARALAWVFDHPLEASAKALRAKRRAQAYSWQANRIRYLTAIDATPGFGPT